MKLEGYEGEDLSECRTSHEVRGLKCELSFAAKDDLRRTSHEVRGLKSKQRRLTKIARASHLTRGAWIEIF